MSDLGYSTSLTFKKFRNSNGPIIDIRSEREFAQGHWPESINVPLLNNHERSLVGITYKNKGSLIAIKEGLKLIYPKLPQLKETIEELNKSININCDESLRVYCWRGGLRSKCVVWFSNQLGINAVQLNGGYKGYRRWVLEQFKKEWPLKIIGGRTGTGKTDLLLALEKRNVHIIDLEGLANHRGSSFGSLGLPSQPTSEHFENLIAESLSKFNKNAPSNEGIWVEDENPTLGKCRVPNDLYKQMKNSPVIEIVRSKNERLKRLIEIYGVHPQSKLEEATIRIRKRLGHQRTQLAIKAIKEKDWERACLEMLHYYDKCYDYQLKKNSYNEKGRSCRAK